VDCVASAHQSSANSQLKEAPVPHSAGAFFIPCNMLRSAPLFFVLPGGLHGVSINAGEL
jgi:hypothetical protein